MSVSTIITIYLLFSSKTRLNKKNARDYKFAIISIGLDFSFCVCNLPTTIFFLVSSYVEMEEDDYFLLLAITNLLFYINYAMMFYINFLFNSTFRRELFKVVRFDLSIYVPNQLIEIYKKISKNKSQKLKCKEFFENDATNICEINSKNFFFLLFLIQNFFNKVCPVKFANYQHFKKEKRETGLGQMRCYNFIFKDCEIDISIDTQDLTYPLNSSIKNQLKSSIYQKIDKNVSSLEIFYNTKSNKKMII
ncbi:hypothetical protein BpHYR1_044339 [Brachionus plicatilis]|uniref:G-protein coupled receptors family 1 profile domain-containing protein n=1 Tax=Brachionus plicatilis TaxID=10195 RepID=A0A3M7QPN5_BRAPC|nr:hypothetical protein BpHYR1_044339 [Brachionus plicatilis]